MDGVEGINTVLFLCSLSITVAQSGKVVVGAGVSVVLVDAGDALRPKNDGMASDWRSKNEVVFSASARIRSAGGASGLTQWVRSRSGRVT